VLLAQHKPHKNNLPLHRAAEFVEHVSVEQSALFHGFAHQPAVHLHLFFEPFEPAFAQGGFAAFAHHQPGDFGLFQPVLQAHLAFVDDKTVPQHHFPHLVEEIGGRRFPEGEGEVVGIAGVNGAVLTGKLFQLKIEKQAAEVAQGWRCGRSHRQALLEAAKIGQQAGQRRREIEHMPEEVEQVAGGDGVEKVFHVYGQEPLVFVVRQRIGIDVARAHLVAGHADEAEGASWLYAKIYRLKEAVEALLHHFQRIPRVLYEPALPARFGDVESDVVLFFRQAFERVFLHAQ